MLKNNLSILKDRRRKYKKRLISGVRVVLFVDEAGAEKVHRTVSSLYCQCVPVRELVIVSADDVMPACKKSLNIRDRIYTSIEFMGFGKGLGLSAVMRRLEGRSGQWTFFVQSGIVYEEDSIKNALLLAGYFPDAVIANRVQVVDFDESGILCESSMNLDKKFVPRRPLSNLIPLISGGVLVGANLFSKLVATGGASFLDGVPESMQLYGMLLLANIPVVETDYRFAFERVCLWDSTYGYWEPDLAKMFGHRLVSFLSDSDNLSIDSTRVYRSGKGNVLLMAGQPDLCGATLSLFALYKHLISYGENVLFVIPCQGPIEELLRSEALDYCCLFLEPYQWVSPLEYSESDEKVRIEKWMPYIQRGIGKIEELIDAYGIDLVHENTSGSFMAAMAALNKGVKLVWHLREFNEEDHGQRLWSVCRPYEQFGRADACVAISRSIAEKYEALVTPPDNIRLIYNGLNPETYCKQNHTLFESKKVVLTCAGRICEGKAQRDIVEALVGMPSEIRKRITLRIVGSQHDVRYVESINRIIEANNLQGSVEYLGVVADMALVWGTTDIAVVPSRFEAFGRCAVEAMLAGCLVVGNATAGTAEIVKDGVTGYLYLPNDITSLMNRLLQAMEDVGESRKIARTGQKDALARFTSEKNAKSIFELHQEILNR